MKPPKTEPMTNIINIAILLWPSSSNPDVVNSVGIGITDDSKLFMNRPISPSFTNYGLFRNVVLAIVIASIIIEILIQEKVFHWTISVTIWLLLSNLLFRVYKEF